MTLQTCTQQLQTFHHAKKHMGSPVKVHNLTVFGNGTVDFDPRPPEFRKQPGYSHFFRNTCIGSATMHKSPITQCFEPANQYAVKMDRSYLDSTDPKLIFLQSNRITVITESEVTDIQRATVNE